MKKTAVVLVLLVCAICSPLFASVTGGVGGLLCAKTEHFDIIYQPESLETAAHIHENCEKIYAGLVQFFGSDPEMHIPVVITKEFKVLNAYYTAYPANRIVLFDTVVSQGDLSNFPDTILYVFRHELTHAFQFNLRGAFTQLLSDIFSDAISTSAMLYMTPSLSEGGAVFSESSDGYGRINNSYSMQIVRQAKLEGLFPSWYDIVGCRDTYPTGHLYYNFAAAFLDYLGLQYGRDAVASLYVDFGNKGIFRTTNGIFRDRLGIDIERAWQFFYQWVNTPEELAYSSDVQAQRDYGHYTDLALAKDGSLYVYDSATWNVLYFDNALSQCKTVMTLPTGNPSLSLSDKGKILVPYVVDAECKVNLYRVRKNSATLLTSFEGMRDGCFVSIDGEEYALLYSNKGQTTYLELYDLKTYEPVEDTSLELGFGVTASSFCSLDDGRAVFILSYKAHDYAAVLDPASMEVVVLENPIDAKLMAFNKGVSDGNEIVCISWYSADAKDGTFGRYGELEIVDDSYVVRLAETDVFGSMNSPVRINDEVLFNATYYDHEKLQSIGVGSLTFMEDYSLAAMSMSDVVSPESAPDTTALEELSDKYRPSRYLKYGTLLPVGNFSYGSEINDFGIGATWITLDPTETYLHQFTAGFGTNGPFVGYNFQSSEVIPYSAYVKALAVTSDSILALGPKGTFCFEAGGEAAFTFNLEHLGEYVSLEDSLDLYLALNSSDADFKWHNDLNVSYGYSVPTGTNPFETKGFAVGARLYNQYPGVAAVVKLPRLLWWIDCNGANVTNLPATFSTNFMYFYDGRFSVGADADVVLFSHEIQRGVPFLGFYFQRTTIEAKYSWLYYSVGRDTSGHLNLSWTMDMSPMIGEYLSSGVFKLGVQFVTDFNGQDLVTLAFGANL